MLKLSKTFIQNLKTIQLRPFSRDHYEKLDIAYVREDRDIDHRLVRRQIVYKSPVTKVKTEYITEPGIPGKECEPLSLTKGIGVTGTLGASMAGWKNNS
jgi:hypothetical protein